MRFLRYGVALIAPFMLGATLVAQSLEVQLQRAVQREIATGDRKAAIAAYKQIIERAGGNRVVAAQARLRLGDAYREQGDAEAAKVYQEIVTRFSDQVEVLTLARTRLADSRMSDSGGVAKRRIWFDRDAERAAGRARISPNCRMLAYVPTDAAGLVLRDLTAHTERTIVRVGVGQQIGTFAWSRDGMRVAMRVFWPSRPDEICVVAVSNGETRVLAQAASEHGSIDVLDWAPNGQILLARRTVNTSRFGLVWANSSNGALQPLTNIEWPPDSPYGIYAHVSPDGSTVVFGGRDDEGTRDIRLIASAGGAHSVLSADARDDYAAGWTPDGRGVLIVSQRAARVGLWVLPVLRGSANGEARPLEHDLCSCGELVDTRQSGNPVRAQTRIALLGVTARGDFFFRTERLVSDIYLAPVDARNGASAPVPLKVSRSGYNIRPQWSPDGRRILLLWSSASQRQLSVVDVLTGAEQRLSGNIPVAAGHCWAGNDAIFVFQRPSGAGPGQFTRINLATREESILFEEPTVRDTSCSSDGRLVGYPYYPSINRLYFRVRNLNTGSTVDLPLPGPAGATAISPDGRSVAFLLPLSNALFVTPIDGGPAREIARAAAPGRFLDGTVLAWSPDGQYVYYVKHAAGTSDSEVFRVRASGGPEERLGISGPDVRNLNISPDGTRIVFAMGPRNRPEIWAIENTAAAK